MDPGPRSLTTQRDGSRANMAKAILVALALVASLVPLHAQSPTCVGRSDHFFGRSAVGDAGNGTKVYGPIVPPDEVWLVDAASLSTTDWNVQAANVEWELEIIEPIPEQTGRATSDDPEGTNCCWRIGVMKQPGTQATPVIALNRSIVLRAGERMAGRHNQDGHPITLIGLMWRFPAACGSTLALR